MATLWDAYKGMDYKAPQPVLERIISAMLVSVEDRKALIQALLTDVKNGRFPSNYSSMALLAIKSLAKIPAGSGVLITETNLRTLLDLGKSSQSDVASEALRCVANAMFLVDSGRDAWLAIGGGQFALDLLTDSKTNVEFCFLAGRMLFLVSLKENDFIKRVSEDNRAIESIAARLDTLLALIIAEQPLSKDAMVDTLKFIFNLLLHYPRIVEASEKGKGKGKATERKVIGEQWDDKFEPLISPLVRVFNSLPNSTPPFAPPLTHSVHALINIPISSYTNKWFSPSRPSTPPSSWSSKTASDLFNRAMTRLSSHRRSSNSRPPSLNSGNGGSKSRSDSPVGTSSPTLPSSPNPASGPSNSTPQAYEVVKRATDIVDATFAHYFPGSVEVDDPSVRERGRKEDVNIDETVVPLLALVARLASQDTEARKMIREWILPADLNRENPLEERGDTLGRCIRLLSSVYFPRLKDAVGEVLFAVCNSDGALLSAQIGYGNAAGYLFNKGILSAPPPPTATEGGEGSSSAFDSDINPITGAKQKKVDTGPEMTEEEKEREAERLFVLFDRLERSGMAQNPIRQAIQEGKLSLGPFGP